MASGEIQPSICSEYRAAPVARPNAVQMARPPMQLKLDKSGTRYRQIARAIRQAVLDDRSFACAMVDSVFVA
jgi:hypothetical protein